MKKAENRITPKYKISKEGSLGLLAQGDLGFLAWKKYLSNHRNQVLGADPLNEK